MHCVMLSLERYLPTQRAGRLQTTSNPEQKQQKGTARFADNEYVYTLFLVPTCPSLGGAGGDRVKFGA